MNKKLALTIVALGLVLVVVGFLFYDIYHGPESPGGPQINVTGLGGFLEKTMPCMEKMQQTNRKPLVTQEIESCFASRKFSSVAEVVLQYHDNAWHVLLHSEPENREPKGKTSACLNAAAKKLTKTLKPEPIAECGSGPYFERYRFQILTYPGKLQSDVELLMSPDKDKVVAEEIDPVLEVVRYSNWKPTDYPIQQELSACNAKLSAPLNKDVLSEIKIIHHPESDPHQVNMSCEGSSPAGPAYVQCACAAFENLAKRGAEFMSGISLHARTEERVEQHWLLSTTGKAGLVHYQIKKLNPDRKL